MLLQPAAPSLKSASVSLFGPGGCGKTTTAIMIALGASIHRHDKAPIAMMDPENVSDFIAEMCAAEGVPLFTIKERSFVAMTQGLKEAEAAGCCAFVVDHYAAVFAELEDAQQEKLNLVGRQVPYPAFRDLERIWNAWVSQFRDSPLHCIFTGRLGNDYEDTHDATGELQRIKIGTKMRGQRDVIYEPDLLIEMERIEHFRRDKISKRKQGEIEHVARVLKDRGMTLNGRSFAWKDLNGYTQGDYNAVWHAVEPHFKRLADPSSRLPAVAGNGGNLSSAALFPAPTGESAFAERARRVTLALDDFKATCEVLWPGRTEAAQACKAAALEAAYGVRSTGAVEHMTAEAVEGGARVLRKCEALYPTEDPPPITRPAVIAFVLATKAQMREDNPL